MLLNVDQLQKQLDKDEFQEDGSMTAFWGWKGTRHQRQYERRVNKRQMQMQESKIDTGKALDADLVDTESIRTDSTVQDDSSRSGNDTDADDADIRPIYDEGQWLSEDGNPALEPTSNLLWIRGWCMQQPIPAEFGFHKPHAPYSRFQGVKNFRGLCQFKEIELCQNFHFSAEYVTAVYALRNILCTEEYVIAVYALRNMSPRNMSLRFMH
ncbi:hypothetical protein Tco_0789747 [Tanacetum coccineum]